MNFEYTEENLKKFIKDNPEIPPYFCQLAFSMCRDKPEVVEKLQSGELEFPKPCNREDPFVTDEYKLAERERFNAELQKMLV